MMHWASGYIGTPWVAGVSDCWSFARRVWRERFGVIVPAVAVDATDPRATRRAFATDPAGAGWAEVAGAPAEGDAVLMAQGAMPCHVGIWVEPGGPGGVLHSIEASGVVFTPRAVLAAMGYRIAGIYRRVC